jgi:mono/diheme cytochrome c family protein
MSLTAQKYLVAGLSLALFAALLVAGRVESAREAAAAKHQPTMNAAALDPQIQRGKLLFVKYSCNACHGAGGVGGIKNLNAESGGEINGLLKVSETYTAAELADKIRKGVPEVGKGDPTGPSPPLRMPAFGDLISGQELNDLVTYVMSLGAGTKKKASDGW